MGEFAGLVSSGSLSLANATRLIRLRALSMQEAAKKALQYSPKLGMQAWILAEDKTSNSHAAMDEGREDDPLLKIRAVAAVREAIDRAAMPFNESGGREGKKRRIASIAAVNAPSQCTVSGDLEILEAAAQLLRKSGILRRTISLQVSAPFHCDIMKPSADALERCLGLTPKVTTPPSTPSSSLQDSSSDTDEASSFPGEEGLAVTLQDSRIPMIMNATAAPTQAGKVLAESLVQGITRPVLWWHGIKHAIEKGGAVSFLELGHGTTLAGLVKGSFGKAHPHLHIDGCAGPMDVKRLR